MVNEVEIFARSIPSNRISISRRFAKKKKTIVRELEPTVRETAAEAEAYDQFDRLYGEILYQGFAESALRMGVTHGRVLDVGVGSSRIAIRLARLNPRFSFDVLALSQTMRELAERCVTEEGFERQIRVSLWDGSKLPFPDGSFDMVISNNLLHRVVDPSVVLKEIQRIARPEGAILVRDVRRLPAFWMELLLQADTETAGRRRFPRGALVGRVPGGRLLLGPLSRAVEEALRHVDRPRGSRPVV